MRRCKHRVTQSRRLERRNAFSTHPSTPIPPPLPVYLCRLRPSVAARAPRLPEATDTVLIERERESRVYCCRLSSVLYLSGGPVPLRAEGPRRRSPSNQPLQQYNAARWQPFQLFSVRVRCTSAYTYIELLLFAAAVAFRSNSLPEFLISPSDPRTHAELAPAARLPLQRWHPQPAAQVPRAACLISRAAGGRTLSLAADVAPDTGSWRRRTTAPIPAAQPAQPCGRQQREQ